MPQPMLQIQGLCLGAAGQPILDRLDLTVREFLGLTRADADPASALKRVGLEPGRDLAPACRPDQRRPGPSNSATRGRGPSSLSSGASSLSANTSAIDLGAPLMKTTLLTSLTPWL